MILSEAEQNEKFLAKHCSSTYLLSIVTGKELERTYEKKRYATEEERKAKHKESTERYRAKVRRFTLQFNMCDAEAREWFEAQPEKGAYLKSLILEDKKKRLQND